MRPDKAACAGGEAPASQTLRAAVLGGPGPAVGDTVTVRLPPASAKAGCVERRRAAGFRVRSRAGAALVMRGGVGMAASKH